MKLNFTSFILSSAAATLVAASQEEKQSLRGSAAPTDNDRRSRLQSQYPFLPDEYFQVPEFGDNIFKYSNKDLRRSAAETASHRNRSLFKIPDEYHDVPVCRTYIVLFTDSEELKDEIKKLDSGFIYYLHEKAKIALIANLTESDGTFIKTVDFVANIEPDYEYELDDVYDAHDPDRLIQVADDFTTEVHAGNAEVNAGSPTHAYMFKDYQWNMKAIKADEAWEAGKMGSKNITIAILDTGIDYRHPDLQGRVDLEKSISFIPRDDFLNNYHFPGRHNITDLHFHGTHVAATAASNGILVAGVTKEATLMGVKVCNVFGQCPLNSVIRGLLYAADAGAHVANLSLGAVFGKKGHQEIINVLLNVFKYVAEEKGMTVVVSAGNQQLDLYDSEMKTLCSAYDKHVICVSATEMKVAGQSPWTGLEEVPAYYTNYGLEYIDVAAPGGGSTGKIWSSCSSSSLREPICRTPGMYYALSLAGTSMSAPHVSGLVALLLSEDPELEGKPKNITERMEETADDLGEKGIDDYFGKGRVNVAKALGVVQFWVS